MPQIFFNARHVGGNEELQRLVAELSAEDRAYTRWCDANLRSVMLGRTPPRLPPGWPAAVGEGKPVPASVRALGQVHQ